MNTLSQNAIADAGQERRIVEQWLGRFNAALRAGHQADVADLLAEDGYWRDLLAHQWDFRSLKGREVIAEKLIDEGRGMGVHSFEIDPDYSAPRHATRAGRPVVEAILRFQTALGSGNSVLRMQQGGDGTYRAWGLMTSLQSLEAYPETVGKNRPVRAAVNSEGENWQDRIDREQLFEGEEPEVLVVGGGQSGLMIAARLKTMGVRALVIESLPRVGDIWRNRYHTLQLHNEIDSIDFPYLSYPKNWPIYLPKDMYAAWMEFYALAMELSVWTSVRFEGADYDEEASSWTARLRMADGSERILRPQHIVMATGGVSGRKNQPHIPGLDAFAGPVVHTVDIGRIEEYHDKKVAILGSGTSAHDLAVELYKQGCEVTMVQRNSTTVVNVDSANLIYAYYKEGRSIEEIDIVTTASDFDALLTTYRELARIGAEIDRDLLQGLEKAGFVTDRGYLDGGFFSNYLSKGGGFYMNVGASEYIVDGRVKVLQNDRISGYEASGVRLKDGDLLEADAIILATGYLNQEADVREYFGEEVGDKVGKIWGWDEGGELRRAWRPTGQKGLWLQLGGVPQSRTYSRFLALQIVAELRNLK